MPCPHCKAEVAPSDVYCISCGARLSAVEDGALARTETGVPARADSPVGPAASASVSLKPAGSGRAAAIFFTVVLNLLLLGASAWLVYTALTRYAAGPQPLLQLGAPRLVRVAPQPTPDEPAPPAATVEPPPADPPTPSAKSSGAEPAVKPAPPKSENRPAPETPVARKTSKPGGKPVAVAGPAGPASRPVPAPAPPSGGESAPAAEPTVEEVRAGLDAESVRMVVRHHLPQVRACHDRALKQQEGIAGQVEIEFEVSAAGSVRSSKVHSNNTGHDGLGRCLAGLLKTWRFPRPVGGDVVFIYPFLFSSGD